MHMHGDLPFVIACAKSSYIALGKDPASRLLPYYNFIYVLLLGTIVACYSYTSFID